MKRQRGRTGGLGRVAGVPRKSFYRSEESGGGPSPDSRLIVNQRRRPSVN